MIAQYTPKEIVTIEALYVCPETREMANLWMGDAYTNVADGEYLVLDRGAFYTVSHDEFHEMFAYRKRVNDTEGLVTALANAGLDKKQVAHALGLGRTVVHNYYPVGKPVEYLDALSEADARMAGFKEWEEKVDTTAPPF